MSAPAPVQPGQQPGQPGQDRRGLPPLHRPKTLGGALYFGVVAVTIVGLVLVVVADWRRGLTVVGIGLIAAGAVRAVLGDYEAGMLRVRRRWFDVVSLVLVGAVLVFLAATIPDQPGQ